MNYSLARGAEAGGSAASAKVNVGDDTLVFLRSTEVSSIYGILLK